MPWWLFWTLIAEAFLGSALILGVGQWLDNHDYDLIPLPLLGVFSYAVLFFLMVFTCALTSR